MSHDNRSPLLQIVNAIDLSCDYDNLPSECVDLSHDWDMGFELAVDLSRDWGSDTADDGLLP
jgi:hypothetical protein